MKHTHKCDECSEQFDCKDDRADQYECEESMREIDEVPTCPDCMGL